MTKSEFSKGLSQLNFLTEYRTGDSDPVQEFYRPCLKNSIKYKRAVGYFRSSIYLIIGTDAIEFARHGGVIRLVCSPSLTYEDLESIESGYEIRSKNVGTLMVAEIDRLLASDRSAYRTRVLATLIGIGALDIRLALRPEAQGLYHEKMGVFNDKNGSRVSFLGSANETWNAWHNRGNHEAIEVFCDWQSSRDAERVDRHDKYFERLWAGNIPGVEIVPFPEAAKRRLEIVALGGIDEVEMGNLDIVAQRRTALPHQIAAIDAWKAAGCRGVFEHATGSGKTFTALLAVKEHIDRGLPSLILVPSALLLEQWATEVREELPEATLLLAGSGNDRWKRSGRLRSLTDPSIDLGPRIIISTMQTAATEEFIVGIHGGNHLMIVADECHQVGSRFNSRIYRIDSGPRLGLSATPVRYGDPDGTSGLFAFFGPVIPPPITLIDAIRSGRLVEYEYHPHPVHLTAEEADHWKTLTRRIFLEMCKGGEDSTGTMTLSDKAKMLLIERSRIAKKAIGKIPLAAIILRDSYVKGQRWLVYCEDGQQLGDVMKALNGIGIQPVEYHSAMEGDRAATLAWFRTFGGVLISIKCLDEGVDIPSIDHALILASSQNPRQFIQRRGRVLRSSKDKYLAVIHDAIVVPVNLENEPDQLSLLKSEFLRAIEFANSAVNRTAGAELRAMATTIGFDAESNFQIGIEEDGTE